MIAHSNHLKALITPLAAALCPVGGKPFEERILVIPDTKMKDWVLKALAENSEWKVAAGLKILNLAASLEAISDEKLPSLMELSLFLETRLLGFLHHPSFEAIGRYLEKEGRSGALCQSLSRIFWDYSLFSGKALKPWSQKRGWQQMLWKEVDARWTLPHRLNVCRKKSLFLFGFAYLPPLYLRLFFEAGAKCFFFSPCRAFFADYASDRERILLERKEGFKEVLEGQHKILANMGRLAKSMQETLEDLGGLFIIPLDAYIQIFSPEENRGRVIAATNFLSFLGVLIASFAIFFLNQVLSLNAAVSFAVIGGITLLFTLFMSMRLFDHIITYTSRKLGIRIAKVKTSDQGLIQKVGDPVLILEEATPSKAFLLSGVIPNIKWLVPKKHVKNFPSLLYSVHAIENQKNLEDFLSKESTLLEGEEIACIYLKKRLQPNEKKQVFLCKVFHSFSLYTHSCHL